MNEINGSAIADSILLFCKDVGLNLDKLFGQGYDGCVAMTGKDRGVQVKIKKQYPKIIFFTVLRVI